MADKIQYRGFTVEVRHDEDPQDPRGWDNLGTMNCWHRRYSLGDKHDYDSPDDCWADIKMGHIVLPLYLYDHSGITMNTTGFSCPWDSGRVGYIYVSLEKVRKEYGWKKITKARREKILEYLRGEVETYDDFITGQVYGFTVKDEEGEVLDSCYGYFGYPAGYNEALSEGKSHVDYEIKNRIVQHLKRLKQWILNKVPIIKREPLKLIA